MLLVRPCDDGVFICWRWAFNSSFLERSRHVDGGGYVRRYWILLEDVFGLKRHLSIERTNLGRAYENYIDGHPGLCILTINSLREGGATFVRHLMIIDRAQTQVARVPGRHAATGHIHDAGHNLFRVVFRVRRVGGMDQSQQTPKDGYKVRTNRNTHRELEIDLSLAYVTTVLTEPGLQGGLPLEIVD